MNAGEQASGLGDGFIREVALLQGERVEQIFVPQQGLVDATPIKGPLLVMTTQRVMSFNQEDGRQETTLVTLADLRAVSVKRETRSAKSLYQGLALVLLGVMAYFFVGLFITTTGSLAIPAAVGAVIVSAGALLMTRYFFWEQEGTITFIAFRGGTWDLSFPYRGNKADEQSSRLVNHFFQLKLALDQNPPPPPQEEEPSQTSLF